MSIIDRPYVDRQGRKQVRYAVNAYNKYTGKTEWVGTYTRRKDAEQAFDDASRRIRMGDLPQERKDIGLRDLVNQWFETLTVRERTLVDYRYTTGLLIEFFRNRPVSRIAKQDVEQMIAWAKGQGYGDWLVRKLKVRLSQVLGVAVDWGYLFSNPAAGKIRNLPKEPRSKIGPLQPDEIKRLLESCPSEHRCFFLLLLSTGLRRSEAFGLTWEDVDLERGEIHVRHQLIGNRLVPPKTRAAFRTIPLPPITADALRVQLASSTTSELNLVFTTAVGTPVNASNFFRRVWLPLKEAAGLPTETTIHQLRKTFATACVSQGRTPAWLAEVMGHSKPETTLAFYTGVYATESDKARDDLNEWLAHEDGVHCEATRCTERVRAVA